MSIRVVVLAWSVCALGCKAREAEPHVVQPAPRGDAPAVAAATPEPSAAPQPERESGHGLGLGLGHEKKEGAADAPIDQPRVPAQANAKTARTASRPRETSPKPVVVAEQPPPQLEPPAPEAPPPAAAKPATRVSVPNTEHVRVEVPAGLQAWLDKDTRMQPWLGKVMKVIDDCYASVRARDANATGTISFRVTMHENARPDPEIESLPGALSGVVACATGQLMRARMPLFTGTEGESYVVRVRFQ